MSRLFGKGQGVEVRPHSERPPLQVELVHHRGGGKASRGQEKRGRGQEKRGGDQSTRGPSETETGDNPNRHGHLRTGEWDIGPSLT